MWFRALTIAALLVALLIVRKRARLPLTHPWLLAAVAGVAASLLSDFSVSRHDVVAQVLYALAALLGLAGIVSQRLEFRAGGGLQAGDSGGAGV